MMRSAIYAFFIFSLAVIGTATPAYYVFAQSASTDSTFSTSALPGETPAQTQARLQSELTQVEQEQADAEATLSQTQAQSASLTRDISVLNGQIKVAQLNIQAKNLLIATLGKNITQKQANINDLNAQIDVGKQTLIQLIQKTNQLDAISLPDVILSGQSLTAVYSDLDTFSSTESALKDTFAQIRANEAENQSEKDQLTTQQNQQIDAKQAIVADQAQIQTAEKKKAVLLSASKNNEKTYAEILAQKQAAAASIRSALFNLAGGANPIPFGDALQYATVASKATGVTPAFLLAELTQESALGANVGSCYVTNLQTGSGVNIKKGTPVTKVMSPNRDTAPFTTITGALGLDPTKTIVSCPQAIGWGGAMGPAQFIPSTWVLFQSRIAIALNKSVSAVSPWNPQDAFMAASLYLGDLGAGSGTYSGERSAACKYYSGSGCGIVSGATSYALSVLAHANIIQTTMIDPLQGV